MVPKQRETTGSRTVRALTLLTLASCLAASLATARAQAQDGPRIAVVDLDRVVVSSSDFKALQTRLKAMDDALGPQLEEKVRTIQTLSDSVTGKTPDEQRSIRKQIEDAQLAGRRLQEDAEREADKLQKTELEKIRTKLAPIIQSIQAEANYDLILNANPGLVLAVGDGLDITQQVIDKLNTGG